MTLVGCPFGTHRVITPIGSLPQAAYRVDNTASIYDNEILIAVEVLNIDSASFTQLKEAYQANEDKMKEAILKIVEERGKMQNPVTGSGGMLIGTVKEVGENFPNKNILPGMKIATLVSLTLTPLKLHRIKKIHMSKEQVEVEGEAILFASGIYAIIPFDLPERLVLAALDVAGAPAQVQKLVKPGNTVCVLGAAGKSGVLCCYVAKKQVGNTGKVIAVVINEEQKKLIEEKHLADIVIIGDATDAYGLYQKITTAIGSQVDLTINVVNVTNTENASILITKPTGIVYFFSMATSFTKAALGAEGIGSDVTMIIGNGYTKNHADITLNLIRESEMLRTLFMEKYV